MTCTTRAGTPVNLGDRVKVNDPWSFVVGEGVVTATDGDPFGRNMLTVDLDGHVTYTYPCYVTVLDGPAAQPAEAKRPNQDGARAAIGLHAVAQHMVDQHLPAPIAIEAPPVCKDLPKRVGIQVHRSSLDQWLDSMVVDEEESKPVSRSNRHELVTYSGRIESPIGEVPVDVMVIRERRPLELIPGGVA